MGEIVALAIPFITIVLLSGMIDKLTLVLEGIMHRIPGLPDKFEWWVAYIIILAIAFLICWQGNFNLFVYLLINFNYAWQGWLLTALLISGGSAFIKTQFGNIETLPSVLTGLTTTVKSVFTKKNNAVQPTQTQVYDEITESYINVETNVNEDYSDTTRYSGDI